MELEKHWLNSITPIRPYLEDCLWDSIGIYLWSSLRNSIFDSLYTNIENIPSLARNYLWEEEIWN